MVASVQRGKPHEVFDRHRTETAAHGVLATGDLKVDERNADQELIDVMVVRQTPHGSRMMGARARPVAKATHLLLLTIECHSCSTFDFSSVVWKFLLP